MLTVFTEEGVAYAATVVTATPNVVTQVKTKETDGYEAIQFGFNETAERHVNKAQLGHTKGKPLTHFREMRLSTHDKLTKKDALPALQVGDAIDVSIFAPGDIIAVSSTSKGKGFQGVIKRHGFHGGPRSHGQKHSERAPGSIGGGGRAGGRVAKGMRMAGRMGSDRVTVRNLSVLQVHPETNEIVIAGAVPGKPGTVVEIRAAK